MVSEPPISGADVAREYVGATSSAFLEALPYLIGFLALTGAVLFLVLVVRTRFVNRYKHGL